jgi:hypothetical protein
MARNPLARAKASSGVPGVGDGDELLAAPDLVVEEREMRKRLDRASGLARDDEQGPPRVERPLKHGDGGRMRGVQDVKPQRPGATPSVRRSTAGARLDPPMPSSTTDRKPSAAASAANPSSSVRRSRIMSGTVSHPSRSVISTGSFFQTVWS